MKALPMFLPSLMEIDDIRLNYLPDTDMTPTWFARERITIDDVRNLPEEKIDIIVSHCAPREFDVFGGGYDMLQRDDSRMALSAVLHRYKESLSHWFFGHYHARVRGEYHGVKYYGLNMSGCSDWWIRLDSV